MASAIDPDKKSNRSAKPDGRRPVPAVEPEPVKAAAAVSRGMQRPAAKAAASRRQAEDDAPEPAEEPTLGDRLLQQTPAWAVSMGVHVVALLAMALIVTEPPKKEAAVSIIASVPDETPFEDLEDGMPENPVESTDPVADVAIPTDVVIEDAKVVADAQDVDAAPLSVDITEFSDITAAATDMLSTIGVAGATGKGFGGRRNAAGLAGAGGGGKDTEDAVDRALRWFIEHQLDDGGWDFDLNACPGCRGNGKCSNIDRPSDRPGQQADRTAATALALLPFLGRGYTHRDGPYRQQLEKGILYLATLSEKNKGQCYAQPAGMYSQGIATIALTEAYAMTQDDRLETPAQLALNFIEKAQYPDGGWKYQPDSQTPMGDTSVTVWQFMALKSGNMAQLKISGGTIKNVLRFLDSVEGDDGARYRYETGEITQRGTTAMGLLCRMYSGWDQDNPVLARGVKYLAEKGPTADLYYSYYATQVMHHYGGDAWKEWNAKMKDLLLKRQATEGHAAGSWYEHDESLFQDQGASAAGRLYVTSMATMMLEVYYRHLPIYGSGATRRNAH